MKASLDSIRKMRQLLATSTTLTQEERNEVEATISALESELTLRDAELTAHNFTSAPHLFEDDPVDRSIWEKLLSRLGL